MIKKVTIFLLALFVFSVPDHVALAAPEDDFVFKVRITSDNPISSSDYTFTIPTYHNGYNYNVDCNDDGIDEATAQSHPHGQIGGYVCDYGPSGLNLGFGTYTIRIEDNAGDGTGFPEFYLNGNPDDREQIVSVDQWGTGKWRSMSFAFSIATGMAVPAIDTPDLSQVTNTNAMFSGTNSADPDVSNWDVSNVENMSYMFSIATYASPDVSKWNVSSVTDMSYMFRRSRMNSDVSNWDTSSVTTMYQMFWNNDYFDQDLGNWNVENVENFSQMLFDVTLSTDNYDSLLKGWSAQSLKPNKTFDGGNSKYCAVAARDLMVSSSGHSWTITDGGLDSACPPEIIPDMDARAISVFENNSSAITISANDPNGDTPIYSISGGADQSRFAIDQSSGVVTFLLAPDYENPLDQGRNNVYEVIVQSSDGTNTDTQTLAITVKDVNDTLPPTDSLTPIYRLYNTRTGVHLYTKGVADRDKILNKFSDFEFTDGGPAFWTSLSFQTGLTPIYRLYNTRTGVHLYTRGTADRDKILNKFSDFEFTDGGAAFYASLTDDGTTPIYRLYNTRTGVHLYTKGVADRDKILNKFTDFEFTDGGAAFYAQL